jgi:membrane fusion protein (multidrug efflux system)
MEQTTQSPPPNVQKPGIEKPGVEKAGVERPASSTRPLPATDEDFHRRPSRTQSSGFRIAIVVAVVVLLIGGYFAYRHFTSYESTDDAQVDGHVNSVSARVSGHVIKLNVEDNQYVEAGTVLVEVDQADYQVAYERAKADFEDAQAAAVAAGVNVPITSVNTTSQVSSTEADVSSASAGIQVARQQAEAAKAQLQEAEANNVKAQNDLARYKQLVDKQEISQQQYDQAIAAAKASAAGVEAARASADAAQQQVTQAQGKLVQESQQRQYRASADAGHAGQSRLRPRGSPAKKSGSRSGCAEFAVYEDRCSREWHRQQSNRRGRAECRSRPGVDEDHQS